VTTPLTEKDLGPTASIARSDVARWVQTDMGLSNPLPLRKLNPLRLYRLMIVTTDLLGHIPGKKYSDVVLPEVHWRSRIEEDDPTIPAAGGMRASSSVRVIPVGREDLARRYCLWVSAYLEDPVHLVLVEQDALLVQVQLEVDGLTARHLYTDCQFMVSDTPVVTITRGTDPPVLCLL